MPQLDPLDSAESEVTQPPESSEKSQPVPDSNSVHETIQVTVLNSLVEDCHNIKNLLQNDVTKVTNSLQKCEKILFVTVRN